MLRFANSIYFFDLPNDIQCSFLHLFGIIEIYKSLIASRFLLLIIQRVLGQSECSTIRVSFQFSFFWENSCTEIHVKYQIGFPFSFIFTETYLLFLRFLPTAVFFGKINGESFRPNAVLGLWSLLFSNDSSVRSEV